MRKKILQRTFRRRDEGVIVVEAMYIVVITMFVLMFVFDLGVLYHNRMVIVAAANEAAAAVGATYNSAARDPFTGYVPPDFFKNRKIYRHENHDLEEQAAKKAQWYASYLVYRDEISTEHKTNFDSNVKTECKTDKDIGCQVVSVNIEREYRTLFINPLRIFGFDPIYTCKATGTAVCYDPIYQMNMMQMLDQMASDVESKSKILSTAAEIESLIKKIVSFF